MGMKKNIFMVFSANMLSLISGLVNGFVIPAVLTKGAYADVKTYTFYISYLGLFNLKLYTKSININCYCLSWTIIFNAKSKNTIRALVFCSICCCAKFSSSIIWMIFVSLINGAKFFEKFLSFDNSWRTVCEYFR